MNKRKISNVQLQTIQAFSKYRKPMTIADVAAATGHSLHDIAAVMPAVADEYNARLLVTESGEIQYHFPHGMHSKYTGWKISLKRFFVSAKSFIKKAGTLIFKIWIAATLIVYVIVFVLLILAAIAAAFAATMAGNKDDRSSSRKNDSGAGILVLRLLELANRVLFYSAICDTPYPNQKRSTTVRTAKSEHKRPLHQSIFSFVFGESNPQNNLNDRMQKSVIAYLRQNKGIMTLPEFVIITELPPIQAEAELLRYMKDYHGEPIVSDNGTIMYHFPELLAAAETNGKTATFESAELSGVIRQLHSFSANPIKSNIGYCILNGFNLLCGLFFLIQTAGYTLGKTAGSYLFTITTRLITSFLPSINPLLITGVVLGIIPILFSILFFMIPALRWIGEKHRNEQYKTENLRSIVYNRIWEHPKHFATNSILPKGQLITPKNPTAVQNLAKEAGVYFDVEVTGENGDIYNFTDIAIQKSDIVTMRTKMDTQQFKTGDVIFDSDI